MTRGRGRGEREGSGRGGITILGILSGRVSYAYSIDSTPLSHCATHRAGLDRRSQEGIEK